VSPRSCLVDRHLVGCLRPKHQEFMRLVLAYAKPIMILKNRNFRGGETNEVSQIWLVVNYKALLCIMILDN